jgi:hypothetical protein
MVACVLIVHSTYDFAVIRRIPSAVSKSAARIIDLGQLLNNIQRSLAEQRGIDAVVDKRGSQSNRSSLTLS